MEAKERASLGFGDELDNLDPAEFAKPKRPANDKPKPEEARRAAEAAGFRSREPVKAGAALPKAPVQQRRRRTGRNVQFNVKLKQETIDGLTAIADANEWGLGETLEKALVLLERVASHKKDI
ncbi:stability/partitioning determinant [Methylobacterium sp. NEAU 140]|uniref:stability/partitioning determinant n=1 Tax=Methylobacterium sp. NEAU 140 TaxID=3064945 RepID=UPI00273330D3|nr:stability/partitioning determinant [Methylobacterium sp. NEAU 140]MDP4026607.1 stability/partitioning determinant [Methylobacterium sp. NEAU 140]